MVLATPSALAPLGRRCDDDKVDDGGLGTECEDDGGGDLIGTGARAEETAGGEEDDGCARDPAAAAPTGGLVRGPVGGAVRGGGRGGGSAAGPATRAAHESGGLGSA